MLHLNSERKNTQLAHNYASKGMEGRVTTQSGRLKELFIRKSNYYGKNKNIDG